MPISYSGKCYCCVQATPKSCLAISANIWFEHYPSYESTNDGVTTYYFSSPYSGEIVGEATVTFRITFADDTTADVTRPVESVVWVGANTLDVTVAPFDQGGFRYTPGFNGHAYSPSFPMNNYDTTCVHLFDRFAYSYSAVITSIEQQ